MDTELEKIQFNNLWSLYLSMIEKIAFRYLNLNEIYTYSYEVRPQLYTVLDKAGYIEKERISDAIQIQNTSVDALIHVKKNVNISYRLVEPSDSQLLFDWVNETSNRFNSINSKKITKKEHNVWFRKKITDSKTKMYMFFKETPVGVLRLDEINNQLQISFSVEKKQRGKGIGNQMIVFALS